MTTTPHMFETKPAFAGIALQVDPINRERTEQSDNVMAVFWEEQPAMWEYVQDELREKIASVSGNIDFLDVGTGSGVWSILVAKHLGAKNVLAIDKSARACASAQKNAALNGVRFRVRNEFYNISSAPYRSCKTIGIYAPYHLYPAELELRVPQHARGGVDGQQVFREQLVTADYHLAPGGSLVFNQMCLGRGGKPEFSRYFSGLMRGCSLRYINIFPPISTREFLEAVYGDLFPEYVAKTASQFPELFFCDGIITRDGKGTVREEQHSIDLKGRSWQDRIAAHRELVKLSL